MNQNQSNNFQEEDISDSSNVTIREIIESYLKHWKWFVLGLILSLAFAFYKLNFIRPEYRSTSTVKIKDDKSGENSTLSAFQDLSIMSRPNQNIEDEIEIMKSKDLIGEVIKTLKLNVKLFTNKNEISNFLDDNLGFSTEFYENEKYKTVPLKINFFISDSLLYRTNNEFIITVNSQDNFTYTNYDKTIVRKHAFGEKIDAGFGEIIVIPNTDLKANNFIGTNILVDVSSIKKLTNSYINRLSIEPKSDFSTILSLTLTDNIRERSEDFLKTLVQKYNSRAISIKEELSQNTSDFVTRRLDIISKELSDVDNTAETLKTKYKFSDAASDIGLNMQSGQEIESQIVQASTQLEQVSAMKEFVSSKDTDDFIPADVGIPDNNVASSTQQYNDLLMQKKRLLKTSTDKNPTVVNINDQLLELRDNIKQGLNNIESSQKISLDALNKQDKRINSRLYSAPRQERQYRDVQRQQQIKEALYLYLLQKREETAITLGVADPNAKIIDTADSTPFPISPKKEVFYLAAGLMGILIPFVIIFLINFLDTKIKTREEVEKLLNIPILGDIPKSDNKKRYLITKDDHSSMAEAFRILRTNLSFLLTHTNKKGKTIFITSTIAGEGKSFISSNLAAALGHAGKKTLLLGMDIRAPKIKEHLGIRGNKGVTNFIIDNTLELNDIVLKVPKVENLDLISSGDIAPNPAELLMNSRVKDLFDAAKENYEYIIVDTAASSIITDTMLLRNYADAFVYIIRTNHLDKRQLGYVKSVYKNKRFPNIALLINGVEFKKGYGYGYGASFENSNKKWWHRKSK